LAAAFADGQVALHTTPSPALAELANPYDPEARQGIEVVGDLSYFNGKYYLYWGPTPGALSALWLLLGGPPISDSHIVFYSVSLIFVFSALMVLTVQREYFPAMPPWIVFAGLLLVATAHPSLWTLNSPSIYTAAIASGQAFYVSGLYFLLTFLQVPRLAFWRLVACGTCWALALGCRLTLAVAIVPLVLLFVARRVRSLLRTGIVRRELYGVLGLAVPLAIGALALGVYNQARFGNPLETGFSYQMVGSDQGQDMQEGLIFNTRYVFGNFLHYVAAPIRLESEFPFVRPWWEAYPPFSNFLARFNIPSQHSVQNASGLIFVTPALMLGVLLIKDALSCPFGERPSLLEARRRSPGSLTLRQVVLAVSLPGLALAGVALLYRVSAGRFLMEVTPSFAILSAISAMKLHQESQALPARRTAVYLLIILTIAVSAVIGFLLALNGADSRFDDFNPELYAFLVNLFSR
jgi:hypothetical protein